MPFLPKQALMFAAVVLASLTACRDTGQAGWDVAEPLVDPLPEGAQELLVFLDARNDLELYDPARSTVATLVGGGSVTGLHDPVVGGDGVLMVATIVQTAAPPPGDRRDEVVVFDASDGARLTSVPLREPDWEACSPVGFGGAGRVGPRTFWFATVKRNVCEDGPQDRMRLHILDADDGEVAVHSVPYRTRVLASMDDGASLFVMHSATTDSWVAGKLDVETGELELGEPYELFQATEPFLVDGSPSAFTMGGIADHIDLVHARPSGEFETVTSFVGKGHGYLLGRTAAGDLFARLDDGVHRVSNGASQRVFRVPTEPSAEIAVSPAGSYVVEASSSKLTVAGTDGSSELTQSFEEGEPWYQPTEGCYYGVGSVEVSPNSSAFIVSTRGGPIAGNCPDVEGAPPIEPHPGSWLVKPSDLSRVVLNDEGPGPPAFSPSGQQVAYESRVSDDCSEVALRSTADPEIENIVVEGDCRVSDVQWVVVGPP